MKLEMAPWEVPDGDTGRALCRDVEEDGEWMWGVAGSEYLPVLLGRKHHQDFNFNLCVGDRSQPYRARYLLGENRRPSADEWKLAWEQGRIGHLFYLGHDVNPLVSPERAAWQVFLRADGLGSWQRKKGFPSDDNVSDIVQDQPQSFRWHNEKAGNWLERPALDWLSIFQQLARSFDSDVAFAARWAAKKREERYVLSATTRHDEFALFQKVLELAIQSDNELWGNAQYIGFQFQLVDDEVPGERAWLQSEQTNRLDFSPRFRRIFDVLIVHFEPRRGGPLAMSYTCVQQWLDEFQMSLFHVWLQAPTQHERMEALLELRAILQDRGLNIQNLLA